MINWKGIRFQNSVRYGRKTVNLFLWLDYSNDISQNVARGSASKIDIGSSQASA